ncbi:hypothetical protein SAMN05216582_11858 [Selenomonas ruminantium]|uniref:Uncharacterized protein n=1 Tax=Selenomonas ruminantium TaxID=971 RepID=A0A1M6VGM6_SELRU|nr:hypothetical protein [Selenomonas ruminantium]SHK80618.1 hypothetical protein SAMN05216582_11858 [Selenomonas ruminantium]
MNKKFMAAAALVAATFSAGLIGNVASANPAPAAKAPIVQQQDQKDVKAPNEKPQKNDIKKQHGEQVKQQPAQGGHEKQQPSDKQPLPKTR